MMRRRIFKPRVDIQAGFLRSICEQIRPDCIVRGLVFRVQELLENRIEEMLFWGKVLRRDTEFIGPKLFEVACQLSVFKKRLANCSSTLQIAVKNAWKQRKATYKYFDFILLNIDSPINTVLRKINLHNSWVTECITKFEYHSSEQGASKFFHKLLISCAIHSPH